MDLREYRSARINQLYSLACDAVNRVDIKDGEQHWAVVSAELRNLEGLIKALHSGNPGYEDRGLQESERESLQAIRHFAKILGALYGPQQA